MRWLSTKTARPTAAAAPSCPRGSPLREGNYGKEMPCAMDIAESLPFQPMNVYKPLKSHDPICRGPKSRIRIGGSQTHLTHITHRIFGASYAFCSWKNMSWPAPDHGS
jgi:hypothetical protein